MYYYNGMICVSYKELTSLEEGKLVVSKYMVKDLLRRNGIVRVNRGGGAGREAMFMYSSLNDNYKKRYCAKYGDPEKLHNRLLVEVGYVEDGAARTFYSEFKYCLNGVETHLSMKLIEEYTLNASVLNILIGSMNKKCAMENALDGRRGVNWDVIEHIYASLRESRGHTRPNNLVSLKSKIKAYKDKGYESLINNRIGNSNTLKITDDVCRLLVALRRSRTPVYTVAQILERFNTVELPRHNAGLAEGMKPWKEIKSIKSLNAWLNSPEIESLWYDAVYGELEAHHRYDLKTAIDSLF